MKRTDVTRLADRSNAVSLVHPRVPTLDVRKVAGMRRNEHLSRLLFTAPGT